jgi:hypothetical protein
MAGDWMTGKPCRRQASLGISPDEKNMRSVIDRTAVRSYSHVVHEMQGTNLSGAQP